MLISSILSENCRALLTLSTCLMQVLFRVALYAQIYEIGVSLSFSLCQSWQLSLLPLLWHICAKFLTSWLVWEAFNCRSNHNRTISSRANSLSDFNGYDTSKQLWRLAQKPRPRIVYRVRERESEGQEGWNGMGGGRAMKRWKCAHMNACRIN